MNEAYGRDIRPFLDRKERRKLNIHSDRRHESHWDNFFYHSVVPPDRRKWKRCSKCGQKENRRTV